MRQFLILILFFLNAFSFANGNSQLKYHLYKGESELKLKGDWKLFWNQLYHEDTTLVQGDRYVKINAPAVWNNLTDLDGNKLPSFGFGTYSTEIISDRAYADAAIWSPGFYCAEQIYLNGKLIGGNGRVGHSVGASSVDWVPEIFPVALKKGENTLIIEVSNFHHSKGGFYQDLEIGKHAHYLLAQRNSFMVDLFTAGAFFMIGLFFLGMYVFWRKSKSFLIYLVLTIAYAVRLLSSGNHVLKILMPDIPWPFAVGIEYLSLYAVWWSTLALNADLFEPRVYKWIEGFYISLMLTVLLPLHIYSQILAPALVLALALYFYGVYRLFVKKANMRLRSFYPRLAFFIFAFGGWFLEFLVHNNLVIDQESSPNLFRMLAVLSLSFLVSEQYATDYDDEQRLKASAENQKKIIESQNEALKTQQLELQVRNQKIETLFREVHHRVKNNLQLIASLLDIENDELDKSKSILEDSRGRVATMSLIHQTLYMNDNLATVDLFDYLMDLTANLSDLHQDQNAAIKINIHDVAFDVDTMVPLGLAMNELITNAFKYAPKGQSTFLKISYECQEGKHSIEIRDKNQKLPLAYEELKNSGYGIKLANRLMQQLLGHISYSYEGGNVFILYFSDTAERKLID